MNPFDSIQAATFDVVTTTFGYNATWTPANGGAEQPAKVLYKDATDKHGLSDEDFEIERYKAEYKQEDFAGLKALVDAADTIEHIQIELSEGVFTDFIVREVKRKYDGKTFVAYLNPPA